MNSQRPQAHGKRKENDASDLMHQNSVCFHMKLCDFNFEPERLTAGMTAGF